MKFGIEVEFGGDLTALINELVAEGLSSNSSVHSYMGHSETEWIVKRDGSVQGGGELVGPPLRFDSEEDRDQVTRAIKCMQRAGCRPIEQAGIHVHIESRGMTPRQISAVGRMFARYEDVLYRLGTSGWRTLRSAARQYAKPLTEDQKKGLAKAKTDDQLQRAYYGSDGGWRRESHGHSSRYCGLNLHSHWYRGTIEFRIFNSSVNPERVQAYIAVCAAIIRDAKNDKLRSIGKGAHALGSMERMTQEEVDKVFFNFISVMRYQAGLSIDDYRLVKRFWKDSVPQAALSGYY